jgi:hypothetical protein
MAGTFLGKYDTTAANNTATGTGSVSVAEGMLPSNINNAFRDIMADIRQHYNTAEWIEYGDGAGTYTPTYVSGTSFTIDGVDVTAIYHASRRIKLTATTPGTIYGTISSSSFSTNTTVNVTWDSGSLSSEAITSVYIGVLAKTNNSIPTAVIASANIVDGAVVIAKIGADAVDGTKIADDAIDSEHYTNGSIDTAHIAADQIVASLIADNAIDSEHYTDGSIDNAHIADDAIDSEHYSDGSIDTAHIAADQITSAKIADDQIDSEHYVDGSIDTAHIADSQITSAKIVDGTIVNADINASAAIDATKIADGTVTSAEFQYINTLSSNAQTQIDAKAATTYVDNAVAGLRTRIIAECASTANVVISSALEAGDVIDGVTLVAGDRVLLKDQSTATENGLYLAVASGAASRDPEHDTIAELSGGMVITNQGTANDNKIFLCTTDTDATLGSTSITYTTITPQNVGTVTSITAGTGLSGGAITSAGTIAIDTATTVDKTTAQTLTNKTLTSPKINEDVAVTSTATELNLLDGVSGLVQADFTKLAAVSSTADELNLLDGVSGLVQADFTKLAAVDSTATELNKLDALSRGSIIYGNASAATTVLTKGTANQVLTSDGTDIAWQDAGGGGNYSVHAFDAYQYYTGVGGTTANDYIDIAGGNYVSFTPTSTNDYILFNHYANIYAGNDTAANTYLMMSTSASIGSGDTKLNYGGRNAHGDSYTDSENWDVSAKSFLMPCTGLGVGTTYYVEQAGASSSSGNWWYINYGFTGNSGTWRIHSVSMTHYKKS